MFAKIMISLVCCFAVSPLLCYAGEFPVPHDKTVIGIVKSYSVVQDESLIEIARKFGLGYNEIVDANPALDTFVPGTGVPVNIPTAWILPDISFKEGIIVNLSEMRLYYFFRRGGSRVVETFPIGIGSEGFDTPTGSFRIIEKLVNPAWHVPESVRIEKPELPKVVPPGPDNPLGSHAMRLSSGSYLIHGTNKPWGVGRRVSHGCIRMYPEDIPTLFKLVPSGARVDVVRQPVKVAMKEDRVYIEVHEDDYFDKDKYVSEAVRLLQKEKMIRYVDTEKLLRAIKDKMGSPADITDIK